MQIRQHGNARLTHKQRAEIQQDTTSSNAELARQYGVTQRTISQWRKRDSVADGSHTRHNLMPSTNAEEEAAILCLRRETGLSLDDIVEVMQRCVNPWLSRSAIWRCLRRHNANQRRENRTHKPESKSFKNYGCGFIHCDLKYLPRLNNHAAYVFLAIDRATRFAYVEIINDRKSETIVACLERFLQAFPHTVHTILTDNGSEFTDRFAVDMRNKPKDAPSGRHPFDRTCQDRGIEHRLITPYKPQTNGMAERFNRRIAEILHDKQACKTNSGKNKFNNHDERNAFIYQFVHDYNRTRLRCMNYDTPLNALYNHAEDNTKAGILGL